MPGSNFLDHLRVVLVETSHPGNIGAAARAMKSMGLARLALVRPKRFPCAEATARASGADDVLHAATVHDSLGEALSECSWVAGTSARRVRHVSWPELDPESCARRVLQTVAAGGEAALVFGREQWGLSNTELEHCHALVHVPTSPGFSSLNLAAAVQIMAWEVRRRQVAGEAVEPPPGLPGHGTDVPATAAEAEGLFAHLERAVTVLGYLDRRAPKLLMRRLRRLFNRAGLTRTEVDILRGICSAIERRSVVRGEPAGAGSGSTAERADDTHGG